MIDMDLAAERLKHFLEFVDGLLKEGLLVLIDGRSVFRTEPENLRVVFTDTSDLNYSIKADFEGTIEDIMEDLFKNHVQAFVEVEIDFSPLTQQKGEPAPEGDSNEGATGDHPGGVEV